MQYKELSNKQIIASLKACSSPRGNRCSECPLFGHGDYHCVPHLMQEIARRIEVVEEVEN